MTARDARRLPTRHNGSVVPSRQAMVVTSMGPADSGDDSADSDDSADNDDDDDDRGGDGAMARPDTR
jgi:hypothetical protein